MYHLILLFYQEGTVSKWTKKEGDSIVAGESICEISFSDLTLAIDSPFTGVLSKIVCREGAIAPVDKPIAEYVLSKEDFLALRESERIDADLTERMVHDDVKKIDVKHMMKEVKLLIENGKLEEDGGIVFSPLIFLFYRLLPSLVYNLVDISLEIQRLARKGDAELFSIFEASFKGEFYDSDNFNAKFFVTNAKDLASEYLKKK